MPVDTRQSQSEGFYGAYGRKNARAAAESAGSSTYTTDGGSRVYDTSTGKLISKNETSGNSSVNTQVGDTSTSGASDLQAKLRAAQETANKIQEGVNALFKNQSGGASGSSVPGVVGSSDRVVADENSTRSLVASLGAPNPAIEAAQKASDDYVEVLQNELARLEASRSGQAQMINQQFDEAKASTKAEQSKEKATTNVALTRVGGYLGTQISGVGVLNNLAATHRSEIASLEAKRMTAIQTANEAIDAKQFEVAKLMAKEAKDLSSEINNRRNKFFDQTLELIREERIQESTDFSQSLQTIDRVAPTLYESISGLDENEAADYIQRAARDMKIDPNLLLGEVNKIGLEREEKDRAAVRSLAQKYISAGINPQEDTFETASAKIRNSREYRVDIAKAEIDLANANNRLKDEAIDYSDPILSLYTQTTGEVVSSPSKARAVMGYADSLLADKEVVGDDYNGPLLDNQIKASDAQKQITSAFQSLKGDTGIGEETVWQWLASEEAQDMTDDEKKSNIMQAGHNPEDFGIY